MFEQKNNKTEEGQELISFFDLLARFDFEDKKKSLANSNSLVSAPKELELISDIK